MICAATLRTETRNEQELAELTRIRHDYKRMLGPVAGNGFDGSDPGNRHDGTKGQSHNNSRTGEPREESERSQDQPIEQNSSAARGKQKEQTLQSIHMRSVKPYIQEDSSR